MPSPIKSSNYVLWPDQDFAQSTNQSQNLRNGAELLSLILAVGRLQKQIKDRENALSKELRQINQEIEKARQEDKEMFEEFLESSKEVSQTLKSVEKRLDRCEKNTKKENFIKAACVVGSVAFFFFIVMAEIFQAKNRKLI
jgi:Mg2+ and Co2+ transporter CorA